MVWNDPTTLGNNTNINLDFITEKKINLFHHSKASGTKLVT